MALPKELLLLMNLTFLLSFVVTASCNPHRAIISLVLVHRNSRPFSILSSKSIATFTFLRGGSSSNASASDATSTSDSHARVISNEDGSVGVSTKVLPHQQATIEVLQRDRQMALQYLKGEQQQQQQQVQSGKAHENKNDYVTPNKSIHDKGQEGQVKEEKNINEFVNHRAAIRLDGMEICAIVSALILAVSVSMFGLLSPNWLWNKQADVYFPMMDRNADDNTLKWYLDLAMDLICFATSTVGMMTGLHSTWVFSLMAVHGRTALGVSGNQTALETFVEKTMSQQLGGFRSFRASVYALLVQCCFVIQYSFPLVSWRRIVTPLLIITVGWKVHRDTRSIMDAAGQLMFSYSNSHSTATTRNETALLAAPAIQS